MEDGQGKREEEGRVEGERMKKERKREEEKEGKEEREGETEKWKEGWAGFGNCRRSENDWERWWEDWEIGCVLFSILGVHLKIL